MKQRVSKKALGQWLAQNRPDLALYEWQGHKGVYRRDVGPAQGFQRRGATWREVAQSLGAIAPAE